MLLTTELDGSRDVASRSDEISVNPMNIQRGTIIDRLHRHNEYRPPWLWSLVEMIKQAHPHIYPEGGVNGSPDQICRLIIHIQPLAVKSAVLTIVVVVINSLWQP